MEAWLCARLLAVMADPLSVDQERGLMDQRRVHTSRLLPLSSVEKPCVRAGGCRGGFVRGDLFRVVRYASTRAREVASNIERKCAIAFEDARNPFQTFYFGFEEIAEKFCQGVRAIGGMTDGQLFA